MGSDFGLVFYICLFSFSVLPPSIPVPRQSPLLVWILHAFAGVDGSSSTIPATQESGGELKLAGIVIYLDPNI